MRNSVQRDKAWKYYRRVVVISSQSEVWNRQKAEIGDDLSVFPDKIHTVFQHPDTDGQIFIGIRTAAFGKFFVAGPIGVVGPVIVSFRMGHQAENPTGRIANTGDIIQRPAAGSPSARAY
jgi:hypothetical protein